MKIKFSPGDSVKLKGGSIGFINSVTIYNGYVIYNFWDGFDKFLNVDEWQIEPYGKKKPIGFDVEYI